MKPGLGSHGQVEIETRSAPGEGRNIFFRKRWSGFNGRLHFVPAGAGAGVHGTYVDTGIMREGSDFVRATLRHSAHVRLQ